MAIPETPHPSPVAITQVASHTEQQQAPREHAGISGPEATLAGAVISCSIVVAGWVAVHYLTLKREREARAHAENVAKETRRRELVETLKRWEQKFVVIMDPDAIARLYYEGGGISDISAAAERFRSDAVDKYKFDRFKLVCGMPPVFMDANGKDRRREAICDAVRELLDFVRQA